jgi:hypothetical protein
VRKNTPPSTNGSTNINAHTALLFDHRSIVCSKIWETNPGFSLFNNNDGHTIGPTSFNEGLLIDHQLV